MPTEETHLTRPSQPGQQPSEAVDVPDDPSGPTWFPARPSQVAAARAELRARLMARHVDKDTSAQAQLLVSELVTNVVQHSDSPRVGVRVVVDAGCVTVEIIEGAPSGAPVHAATAPRPADPAHGHGRGLGILDVLATEWGVRRQDRVTTTWFTIERPASASVQALSERAEQAAEQALIESLQSALGRSQMLLRLAEKLAHTHSPDQVAEVITRSVREHVGAVFTGIALPDDDPATMHYLSLDPLPEATAQAWASFRTDPAFPVSAAFLHDRAYFHPDSSSADAEFPGIAAHMDVAGAQAMAHLPLTVRGRATGTLAVAWATPQDLDADQQALLRIVAGYAAQALARR